MFAMQASLPPTQTLRTLPLETLEGGTRKIIPFTTDPRHPFKLLFLSGCFRHRWFHSCDSTSDHVMANSLLPEWKVNLSIQICFREEYNRCKIHCIDKISLELQTFEEFANAVLQTLAICAKIPKKCLSSCDHFS